MMYLLSLLAGGLAASGFAPFDFWYLSIVGFAVLLTCWQKQRAAKAFYCGLWFGLGLFGVGVSWIYVSLHVYGNMSAPLAGFATFLLVFLLALYPALVGALQASIKMPNQAARLMLLIPALWVIFEWTRGWLFSGLPWLNAGYLLLDTWAAGYGPIMGMYGLSLLVLMTAGALSALITQAPRVVLTCAVVTMLLWAGAWWVGGTAWIQNSGEPLRVTALQRNVALSDKWDPNRSAQIVEGYLSASEQHMDSDLIVWPEAAVPGYLHQLDNNFWLRLKAHPADFVFGLLDRSVSGDRWQTHNTVAAVGQSLNLYHKQHLVPFGEYFPLKPLSTYILSQLEIPLSDMSPWLGEQQPLPVKDHRAAVSICYEDAFPAVWRNQVADSTFLLNVSEEAWFGDSFAPHQRLQMARFRALETGRPMVRSANNGLTAIIDNKGDIIELAGQFTVEAVTASIQPTTGTTPYVVYGNKFALLLAVVFFVLALLLRKQVSPQRRRR